MNFGAVLTKDFLLSYQGRTHRAQYWAFFLVQLGASIIASIVDGVLGAPILTLVVALGLLYPAICIAAKRWHDRDKSGWWTLILLIPLIGALWMLIECGFLKGSDGANRFGPDPLASA